MLVYYKNYEGDYVDSPIETVGVTVGNKVDFSVTPVAANVTPGANAVITFQFQNTGGTTAYNAEARISAIDPFTSNDDTAFLGTMAPGDVRTASFSVAVDSDATVKEYGLDSEVIYRDALDNQFTSDPLKANVEVVPVKSVVSLIGVPYLIAILIVVLAIRRLCRLRETIQTAVNFLNRVFHRWGDRATQNNACNEHHIPDNRLILDARTP